MCVWINFIELSSLDAFLVRKQNIELRPGGKSPEVKFLSVDVFSRQAVPYEKNVFVFLLVLGSSNPEGWQL